MALIRKAARLGNLPEGHRRIQEKALGRFDAALEQPAVRGQASCLSESSGEVTARQAAFARQLCDGDVSVEAGAHSLFRAPLLPRRQSTMELWRLGGAPEVSTVDVSEGRECNVVKEQRARFGRLFKR